MKPPRFEYFSPRTLDEAISLLERYAGEARVLAGGQSLMPLLNMRLSRPAALIDINRIGGLDTVHTWDGGVSIGATVRQRALQREPLIAQRVPVVLEIAPHIGHQQIRSRGTICGSIAHADPAAELPALAVAMDAEMVASGPRGERTIAAAEFFHGYLTTALEPSELLSQVRFAAPPATMQWSFIEVSRRHGDFALVGVIAGLSMDTARRAIAEARIVVFGVGPKPTRASDAERMLVGAAPGDEAFASAAAAASAALDPIADVHATAEYRKSVSGALTRRALHDAFHRLGKAA